MDTLQNKAYEKNVSFQKKVWITAAVFSLFIIFILLFNALFSVLLLILAGVLIAVYFYGFAGILQRSFHWPQKLSIILSVIINLILIAAIIWFVGAKIQQQSSQLADTLPATLQNAKEQISKSSIGRKLIEQLDSSGDTTKALSVIKRLFSSSFGILSDLYIVILLGAFFTASPSLYKKGMVALLPSKAKEKGADIINKINNILKKWLKGQIFGIAFIGVLTAVGLLIIGMPLVLTLAIIAGLLNFIPNFGPLIALVPAVLISLTQGPETALIIICMYTFIQIIQSAVTQPLIQKKMINIPPALTIIGQVALGLLAGFWGVLLATPIIAILMIVIKELYIKKQ
ncbi:MAG TPA: AI-2E family transporter [Chitinophagaceae bacterium]|nr:AI-2E family transporter [Chitinophagaceae bacterium]